MKKLLLGGALCAMLSTGAFGLTAEECQKYHDKAVSCVIVDVNTDVSYENMKNFTTAFNEEYGKEHGCNVEVRTQKEYVKFCKDKKNSEIR